MTLNHKARLLFSKLKWMKKGREVVQKRKLRTLKKIIEIKYNEGYRKNPTNHDVLRMEGQLLILKQLLND